MYVQQGYGNRSYAPKGKRSVTSYHQTAKHTGHSLLTFMELNDNIEIFIINASFDAGYFIYYLKKIK